MHTRREFLRYAAFLAGGTAASEGLVESIAQAAAIEPTAGSTFLDAEHVVILMQENRSFDHTFGTLRGVRGFNDPRAMTQPDGNPVWAQANSSGERHLPFRLDIHNSRITWMGSLPHGWSDQTDARNGGRFDRWLTAKRSSQREFAAMPLTMGYYTRADIPFYYALADAFTVCDQYFCSTLTGTTPNRLHLWTGTIRERPSTDVPANVRNEEVDFGRFARWPTFPERLEDLGVSWKIYQNELSVPSGFVGDEDNWLGNYDDNPIEFFRQFHVLLAPQRRKYVDRALRELPGAIAAIDEKTKSVQDAAAKSQLDKERGKLVAQLKSLQAERTELGDKTVQSLSDRERSLHERAFCTNVGDPAHRELVEIAYRDGDQERRLRVPKGDVLHQFRADVAAGRLPTVSWLVAPEKFSDHPSSAWFGAWYLAEAIRILTSNPEVWKKTVFILNYDENDGYFDHVPPFVAPHPRRPETGKTTAGIDASLEHVELEDDLKRTSRHSARGGPIGLGYRVPMIVASPWSRGGRVCSQVFDHTSVIQFLETLLSHKLGRKVEEPNINSWRRAVCGDLTSALQAPVETGGGSPAFPGRDDFLASIHRAQFKDLPGGYQVLTAGEIEQIRRDPASVARFPRQEPGVKPSCPLPYELAVSGSLTPEHDRFRIAFEARNQFFRERSAGAAFIVYSFTAPGTFQVRNYAVEPGGALTDVWLLEDFESRRYRLRVDGPNGFFREFTGDKDDPAIDIRLEPERSRADGRVLTGNVEISLVGRNQGRALSVEVRDNFYGKPVLRRCLESAQPTIMGIDCQGSAGWYDMTVRVEGAERFEQRFAGRTETGRWSTSDPAMGAIVRKS